MAISSQGIGSGLDVNSIVTQLVALEKQPLKVLQTAASKLQSQVSVYGSIKSQIATLQDAATKLAKDSSWAVQSATSSNVAAASVSASSTAKSAELSLNVTSLAKPQSVLSQGVDAGDPVGLGAGSGTLQIEIGNWATGIFSSAVPTATINETDNYTQVAAVINAANAGVKATVLTVDGKEQLAIQSTTTGSANGFRITATGTGLESLSYTAENVAATPTGMQKGQRGANAAVEINGISLSPATNTLTDIVPGVTVNLLKAEAAQISVVQDKAGIQTNIQAFADAYTALSKTLSDATKYVPGGQSGVLQGDTTTVGLQRLMRDMFKSTYTGSPPGFKYPSDVGLELQTDGSLKVNGSSLTAALGNMASLQTLFTYGSSGPVYNKQTDGFGVRFRELTKELLNASGGATSVSKDNGFVTNKAAALQASITRNSDEQDRVNTRASAVEKRLRAQYSALDAKMATMSSLSSYVTAQLAQWNKTTG
jgi:flagellar hook-associated protein 2